MMNIFDMWWLWLLTLVVKNQMKDDPEKNAAALKELLKDDANKRCADCGQLGTSIILMHLSVCVCVHV